MPVKVVRKSDGESQVFEDITPGSTVNNLKDEIRKTFPPKYKGGCRLFFAGKVLKSRHHLKHYKIQDNAEIIMDDTNDWSSSSSDSSDHEHHLFK